MDLNKELTREKEFIKFENKTFNENVIRQNGKLAEQIKNWKLEDISEYNKPVKIKRGLFRRFYDFLKGFVNKVLSKSNHVQ